ncbi:MAG TPA: protein translocase subunit SecF [Frankiaceae bacterium]|nr:protein translocase subunit SecF [Frankiaceae bacterium]
MSLATRLYRHEVNYDFITPRKRYYMASAIVILICLASLLFRGFHLGIDFKGGASFEFPRNGQSISVAQDTVRGAGTTVETAQVLSNAGRVRIQTPPLDETEIKRVTVAIQQRFNVTQAQVSVSTVGASWGSSITKKALQGLAAFLLAVVIFISIRFEPKMAAAAIVSLIHDLVITAGIYSIVGFEVTPSTVIALLTILGFSLYDTVVVFDKVRENTAGLAKAGKRTYAQATNDAVNQTLMRSINTSIIALLPVAALLIIGAGLLGAGTLKDLALAQLIGLASGAYSSIFIAAPLLVDLKQREPAMQQLNARVARAEQAASTRKAVGSTAAGGGGTATLIKETDTGPDADGADEGSNDGTEAVSAASRAGRTPPRRQAAPRKASRGGRSSRPSGKRKR